jgi:KTSC domain
MIYSENCESSAIWHISFSPDSRTMTVIWRTKNCGGSSGVAYYYEINGSIYEKVVSAPSKGAIIQSLIRTGKIVHFETESV